VDNDLLRGVGSPEAYSHMWRGVLDVRYDELDATCAINLNMNFDNPSDDE
jgi:hypothetical protein